MNSIDRVRVGLVGLGAFGRLHLETLLTLPEAQLVAVCDGNEEQVRSVASQYGITGFNDYRALCAAEGIDAVIVATPPSVSPEIATLALDQGKAVLAEKPIATELAVAHGLCRTAAKASAPLMVGYVERFNSAMRRAKMLVDSGRVGAVAKISSRRASRFEDKPDWVWDNCGIVVHVGGHDVDLIRWLVDDVAVKVHAEGCSFRRGVVSQPDNVCIVIRFQGGAIGVVESSWTLPTGFPGEENDTRMDIIGSGGALQINNLHQMLSLCDDSGASLPSFLRWPGDTTGDVGLLHWALKDQLSWFCACVRGERQPPVTPEHATETLRILLAANHSIATGQPVHLPSFGLKAVPEQSNGGMQ